MRSINFLFLGVIFLFNCTHDQGQKKRPSNSRAPSASTKLKKGTKSKPSAVDSVLAQESCQVFKLGSKKPPFFVTQGEAAIVVTRILKPCVTREGDRGYELGSQWMAMGFPCTSFGKKILIRGKSYAPKMISLPLSIDCQMNPQDPKTVVAMGREVLGMGEESKLIAHNPFEVQYWEIDGLRDAGTGNVIELRTTEAVKTVWPEFKKGELALKVRLYGRENAWVRDDKFYEAIGEFTFIEPNRFKLMVLDVKSLSKVERKKVYKRCTKLKPRRKCREVFKG